MPTKLVNKAKSDAHGNLEKAKCRVVARGDLQKDNDWEDAWRACASVSSPLDKSLKIDKMSTARTTRTFVWDKLLICPEDRS